MGALCIYVFVANRARRGYFLFQSATARVSNRYAVYDNQGSTSQS